MWFHVVCISQNPIGRPADDQNYSNDPDDLMPQMIPMTELTQLTEMTQMTQMTKITQMKTEMLK